MVIQTEEFIAGLNLLACYTFLDQSCEYILKHAVSHAETRAMSRRMQRDRFILDVCCCKVFLIFPNCVTSGTYFKKDTAMFVEKLASKPPAVEKRIKLLQDIASELSIRWDSKGFKQRIEKPSTLAQALGSVSGSDGEHKPPNGNNMFRKNDQRSKERVEHAHQGPTLHGDGIVNVRRKDALDGPVLRREEKHHKERTKHHDVVDGPVLRREEKRQKERTEHHDDGNVYGRRKEVSDVSNVETNKKHGYKHENLIGNPESNLEKNIFGKNDRIPKVLDDDRVMRERKERNAYKHELETNETRDNNVLDGSVLRREEKRHKEKIYHHDDSRREEKHRKERIYHHDDGNAYGRKKELSDIPYVENEQKTCLQTRAGNYREEHIWTQ
ncbi:putative vacuolar protein sorting-associated protein Ist1 [Helianthus debilis subsp. tardiflorus]